MRDDLLRETMARAVRGEPVAGDPWTRFQMRKRRGQRLRNLIVALAGVSAALALVFVLPSGLSTGPVTDVPAGGPFDPDLRLVNLYQDPVAGFSMRYPTDWVARGEPGEPVAFFLGVPDAATAVLADQTPGEVQCVDACGGGDDYVPLTERPRRVFVEMLPVRPSCASALAACAKRRPVVGRRALAFDEDVLVGLRDAGATVQTSSASIGPVLAGRFSFTYPAEPRLSSPTGDAARPEARYWCEGCRVEEFVLGWFDGWVLDVRIVAPSSEAFADLGPLALRIVESIAPYASGDRL